MTSIANNPDALARYVEHLGGEIVPAPTFRFQVELGKVREIIPEINRLGLQAVKVDEHTGSDANGKCCSIATVELRRKPEEKSEYDQERNLMMAVIR
jgi:hypothetical protein